jgi:glycosyltransferase involved in cell wall biosynthesis
LSPPAKFNPLFICTQNPGVNYYRSTAFANAMGGSFWPKSSLLTPCTWEATLANNDSILQEVGREVLKSSVVIMQRLSTLRGLATMQYFKQNLKMTILTEIDDDAFAVDSSNPGFGGLAPNSEAYDVFLKQMRMSHGIVVSTHSLRNSYYKVKGKVYVMPNSIDFSVWGKLKRKKHKGKIRIVWQGGVHHGDDLQLLMPVVPKILKRYKNVEFHFFGYFPPFLHMDRTVGHEPVPILKYPQKMAELGADIIVAPLCDTRLNRARSNLRCVEAGAMSVPVVASGGLKLPYRELLTKSGGGMTVANTDEWVTALAALIENENLRIEMGNLLHESVLRDYNLEKTAKEYENLLLNL